MAAKRCQATAEVATTDTVDDEVKGRVGRHDEVADVEVVEVGVAALIVGLGEEVVQQLVDVSWSLRDKEDGNDDEHDERDVVALVDVRQRRWQAARSSPSLTRLHQLSDETDVEEDQQAERTQIDDEAIQNVLVDDLVRFTVHEFAATTFVNH